MSDADARRRQLEAWRKNKAQKTGKTAALGSSARAAAPAQSAAAKNPSASASSKASSKASTSMTKTAPTGRSSSSTVSRSSAASSKPTLTPTRLRFADTTKPAEQRSSAAPPPSSVTSIRAKLAASAKKRKRALDERKSRVEAMESARKSRKVAETQAASAQVVKKDTQKHLENMVHEQVEVAQGMIKCKQYEEARAFLRQLRDEVPTSLAVGAFWMKLIQIEVELGNRVRTGSIYAHALRHCTAPEVLEACSKFLESELFPPSMNSAWSLDDLLADGELVLPASDDPLDAFLTFNPDTVQKPPRRALSAVNSAAPASASRLGSALRSGAKRIPVKFQEESILETDETATPPSSAKRAPSSVQKSVRLSRSLSQNTATGSIVAVASVKNKPSKASLLGSEVSMTPVRRSARLQKTPSSQADILRASNYSYTPNPQFDLSALR